MTSETNNEIVVNFTLENEPSITAEFNVERGSVLHNFLLNRDLPDQHPISAITGLSEAVTGFENHIADKDNPHEVTKAQVGLGNVDNTSDLNKPISTATQNALDVVNNNIDDIEELIPNQATASNQLADKSFVNSSIATNTANFIGTFNSVAELEAYSGTVTNNDYAFVVGTDSAGNTVYDRYKYTDATTPASWIFEYELNNSSFTAAQWDAINSGVTSSDVSLAQSALQSGDNISILVNDSGYITSSALSGYATETWVGNQGYITGITSSDVTTALGYTPYDSNNPNGYTSNVGTVTSVNNVSPVSGNVTLTASDVGAITDVKINNTSVVTSGIANIPIGSSNTLGVYKAQASWGIDVYAGILYCSPAQEAIIDRRNNGTSQGIEVNYQPITPYKLDYAVKKSITTSNQTLTSTEKTNACSWIGAQETLVSGTNIKTINNTSLLGSGDITVYSLPSQTGQSGKYLTTNGSNESWATLPIVSSVSSLSTNSEAVGAKLFYDTCGDIETLINAL